MIVEALSKRRKEEEKNEAFFLFISLQYYPKCEVRNRGKGFRVTVERNLKPWVEGVSLMAYISNHMS